MIIFGNKKRSSSQSYQVRVMRVSESTGLFLTFCFITAIVLLAAQFVFVNLH